MPFQTWEYSPEYSIRSWAYLYQYVPLSRILALFHVESKVTSFYFTRICLGLTSSLCEGLFLHTVAYVVHPRVAFYTLAFLLFSIGMFESSTALLPSSFVMYTTTLACAYSFYPSIVGSQTYPIASLRLSTPPYRTLKATCAFASGAILAWPFALVLALPFVMEEVSFPSGLVVPRNRFSAFIAKRILSWATCVAVAALIVLPVFVIDTLAYGKPTIVALNSIIYNVLSKRRGAGPELYGVEPWYYYLFNLTLNFGPSFWLAITSLPAIFLYRYFANDTQDGPPKKKPAFETSRYTLLLLRILPMYSWLALLTLQPHKEERFVYPAYPLLCFNAAVCLFCIRGLIGLGMSRIGVSKVEITRRGTSMFLIFILLANGLFSVSRLSHLMQSYHAPFSLLHHFAAFEAPTALRTLEQHNHLRLCYGKEWYRFPTTYLVPSGVDVDFIRSDFRGILPKHFLAEQETHQDQSFWVAAFDSTFGWIWPWKKFTRTQQSGFNDMNREEMDRYVDVKKCDYLVDLDFDHRHAWFGDSDILSGNATAGTELRFVQNGHEWEKVRCFPFLDAHASRAPQDAKKIVKLRATLDRIFWLPDSLRGGTNQYGEYCLLRSKSSL